MGPGTLLRLQRAQFESVCQPRMSLRPRLSLALEMMIVPEMCYHFHHKFPWTNEIHP